MKKYKSESTVKPIEMDTTSSPDTVYINSNIKKIEKKNIDETQIIYQYIVSEYDKNEYFMLKAESNIEFIAMETGVGL